MKLRFEKWCDAWINFVPVVVYAFVVIVVVDVLVVVLVLFQSPFVVNLRKHSL